MMFSALFKKPEDKRRSDDAKSLYAAALAQTRNPIFYETHGVPDSFDGRFDLLLLHLFLILNTLVDDPAQEDLAQALFDVTFKDMDQTLRERGIGDMGVPKHMRRMMTAFNGRMHAYRMALNPETPIIEGLKDGALSDVLRRNLFGALETVPQEHINAMESYIRRNAASIKITNGQIKFI